MNTHTPERAVAAPIDAAERPLSAVFSDEYVFEIPPYQRPYAWDTDRAGQLFDDVMNAIETKAGIYFLGSIVLIKEQRHQSLAQVIDGQQRLTTLTILFSLLRDISEERVAATRNKYVFQLGDPDQGTEDRPRLTIRRQDQPFLRKHVQSAGATKFLPASTDGLSESQRRIVENAKHLRSRIAEKLQSAEDVRVFISFLIMNCYMVVVSVPNAETARRIFIVLNARGMDLTPTDILKADLLERAGHPFEEEYARRWEEWEETLGRERFVQLFAHIRMIHERAKPRVALETGFRAQVTDFGDDVHRFMSDILEPFASAYELLLDSRAVGQAFGASAESAAASLNRLDNVDWQPPAILLIAKLGRGEGAKEEIAAFLCRLERLAYFLFVTRADVNERIDRFAKVIGAVGKKSSPTEHDPLELASSEKKSFLEALDGPIYLKSRVVKPVLLRLDEFLSTKGAVYSQEVSVEHVLPQTVNPDSGWAQLFPDERSREKWTNKLANLVLLTHRKNSSAQNYDFEKKKDKYFRTEGGRTPFPLTQEVLEESDWTKTVLIKRQQKLLQTFTRVWELGG